MGEEERIAESFMAARSKFNEMLDRVIEEKIPGVSAIAARPIECGGGNIGCNVGRLKRQMGQTESL